MSDKMNQQNIMQTKSHLVSASFLNVKNFKANFSYVKKLADMSDITYLNELWLKETEINQIRSIKQRLFPNNIPQERYENFSSL